MPIGITDDHEALRTTVRRFIDTNISPAVVRAASSSSEIRHDWEAQIVALGWSGLAVSEANGGSGYSCVELGVVIEEFGRACAPGNFVASAIAATVLDRAEAATTELAGRDAIAIAMSDLFGGAPGAVSVSQGLVLGSGDASAIRVVAHEGAWWLTTGTAALVPSLDVVRPMQRAVPDTTSAVRLGLDGNLGIEIVAVLLGAEAVGIAQWCIETASMYAKDRVQFGKPIGQFQGVKHRCADMLSRTELARAAVWDALRAIDDPGNGDEVARCAAIALAMDSAFECAKDCIQILGGIGFTWEHDAHFYLRRAMSLRALVGSNHTWRVRAAKAAMAGGRRRLAVDLGEDASAIRERVKADALHAKSLDGKDRHQFLADEGYVSPGWPSPYGRAAGALEMLVIEEEFRAAKVPRPSIGVGGWAIPNVIVYGTEQQRARWIMPTLHGAIGWCQLFSEPGAGSDLASLTTKAVRGDGGWIVNGQKVWTSMAKEADWGILLARTKPDSDKHDGISCFMLDMKTEGIDIRPLRELTGHAMFNEVFLNDVFIPDDCLIGVEHDGWRCARTTLANERVFMGGASTIGAGVVGVLQAIENRGLTEDSHWLDVVGGLVITSHALATLGFRLTLSALGGADPSGSEAAVRKLLGVQHDQHTQEVGVDLSGELAAIDRDDAQQWTSAFLFNRCLSIAGGTTEIQKNVIGERLLGLPRD